VKPPRGPLNLTRLISGMEVTRRPSPPPAAPPCPGAPRSPATPSRRNITFVVHPWERVKDGAYTFVFTCVGTEEGAPYCLVSARVKYSQGALLLYSGNDEQIAEFELPRVDTLGDAKYLFVLAAREKLLEIQSEHAPTT
jgi:hypothetical protein